MKITASKLRQIIQEELSSLSEISYRRTEAESESENMALVKDVIMLGLEAYTSGKLSKEDEREYGQDVQDILERNAPITRSISDIVREIELQGSRQGTDSGAAPGSALEEFDRVVQRELEEYEGPRGLSAEEIVDDMIGSLFRDSAFYKRALNDLPPPKLRTRAIGIAKDVGYE